MENFGNYNLRVEITDDGYKMHELGESKVETGMDGHKVLVMAPPEVHFVKQLPEWMAQAVAMLSIMDDKETVKTLGMRYSSTVFYLAQRGKWP